MNQIPNMFGIIENTQHKRNTDEFLYELQEIERNIKEDMKFDHLYRSISKHTPDERKLFYKSWYDKLDCKRDYYYTRAIRYHESHPLHQKNIAIVHLFDRIIRNYIELTKQPYANNELLTNDETTHQCNQILSC